MYKLLLFFFLISGANGWAQQIIQNVDAAAFKKLIDSKSYILIDLRTTDELVRKGKIPGAKQIDFLSLGAEKEISNLDKKKKYLIYCAGGGRSEECANLMKAQGFEKVVNLEKGYDDWKQKGFKTQAVKGNGN